jgi:molybdate transport system permease protein
MNNFLTILFNTIQTSSIAALISLPLAVWFGWIIAHRHRRRCILTGLLLIPVFISPVLTGLGVLWLLGRLSQSILGYNLAFTTAAMVFAAVITITPWMSFVMFRHFHRQPKNDAHLAQSLGMQPSDIFFNLAFIPAIPTMLIAFLIGFCQSAIEFSASLIAGGNIPNQTQNLSLAIYADLQSPIELYGITPLVLTGLLFGSISLFFVLSTLDRNPT